MSSDGVVQYFRVRNNSSKTRWAIESDNGVDVVLTNDEGGTRTMKRASFLNNYVLDHVEGESKATRRASKINANALDVPTRKELVTPATAEKWLAERDDKNRAISQATVLKYAADMRAGKWQLSHQSIAFNAAGKLIDGQHRLAAVVQSGKGIEFLVSRYVGTSGNAVKLVCDTGRSRNAAQVLEISGTASSGTGAQISAIVNYMGRIEVSGFLCSPSEMADIYEREKANIEWVREALPLKRFGHVVRAAFAYAHETHPAACKGLASAIVSKEHITAGSPAQVFLNAAETGAFKAVGNQREVILRKVLRLIMAQDQGESLKKVQDGNIGLDFFYVARLNAGKLVVKRNVQQAA